MTRTSALTGCLLCVATTPSAQACDPSMYYLEGTNRGDGMSTSIDLHSGYIRVTGSRFDAAACSSGALCFTSEYMTFSSPPLGGTSEWTAEGQQFTRAGRCTVTKGELSIEAVKIVSRQKYGVFDFYFDRARNELVGWKLRDADAEGDPAVDTWMASGWSACP